MELLYPKNSPLWEALATTIAKGQRNKDARYKTSVINRHIDPNTTINLRRYNKREHNETTITITTPKSKSTHYCPKEFYSEVQAECATENDLNSQAVKDELTDRLKAVAGRIKFQPEKEQNS